MFLKRFIPAIVSIRHRARATVSSGSAMRRPRDRASTRRLIGCEPLEARNLLAAEGAVVSIAESFDTTGLSGSLTSTVRWADGTTSRGTVRGSTPDGPLRVQIVYSENDPFFSGANASRRSLLQTAVDSIIDRLTDDLAAIRPSGLLRWSARTTNPITGNVTNIPNLSVAANELVIYAGSRDLGGNRVGEGSTGTYVFPSVSGITPSQAQQIQAFRNTVITRGESGVTGNAPTDYATWGGSLAFDSDTNYHFGLSTDGLDRNEVDFVTVAMHELTHVLGLGIQLQGGTTSWEHLTRNGTYLGPKGNAAYAGSRLPLSNDGGHFSTDARYDGQPLLTSPIIPQGERLLLTPIDLAVLDDVGWSVQNSTATVTASHVYADDGNYPVEVELSGSKLGRLTSNRTIDVTNVAPSVTVPSSQSVYAGQALSLSNLGVISDPGYRNNSSDPATDETFQFMIDWRDGSPLDRGAATIDRPGTSNPDVWTLASFDGSHVYRDAGNYSVDVTVTDDDGGTRRGTFEVQVIQPPQLSLTLSNSIINEADGGSASVLTIRRSGPELDSDQTITLNSNDRTEATVPASVTIRAGETIATAVVAAIDDTVLDGTQSVILSASARILVPDEITLEVTDAEFLTATISTDQIREDDSSPGQLTIRRSNTDLGGPLIVNVGGPRSELNLENEITIPANSSEIVVPLLPINDEEPEPSIDLVYSFTAAGYGSATVELTLLDDEPPQFQNPDNRFDVDGNGETTVADALRAINAIARRGDDTALDPSAEQPAGVFLDTNGDYLLTSLDALLVINQLSRLGISAAASESTRVDSAFPYSPPAGMLVDPTADDDDEDELLYDVPFDVSQ